MEFQIPEDQEEDEEEEEEEEELLPPASYNNINMSPTMSPVGVIDAPPTPKKQPPRYRECLKNHAVGIGAHAVDGCGEFLPSGPDGTMEALKCAACGCHRNFHRKETTTTTLLPYPHPHPHHHHLQQHYFLTHNPHHHHHHHMYHTQPSRYYHMAGVGQQRPLALPSTSGGGREEHQEEDVTNPGTNNVIGGTGLGMLSRKRHRTKFSSEQKEKMLALAERLGWRMTKEDEAAVQQLCAEIGIKRHVLKVWMHNNKNTLGKKETLNFSTTPS